MFKEKISNTSDYSIFVHLPQNRKLKNNHVLNLMESIKKDDRLHLHPIIVCKDPHESKFFIMDGQHRLEAAKKLNKTIYYMVNENPIEDAIIDDQIQNKWGLEDYLNYFCEKNFKEYLKIQNLIKKHSVTVQFVFLLFGQEKFSNSRLFRLGKIVVSKEIENFLDLCVPVFQKIKIHSDIKKIFYRRNFIQSLYSIYRKESERAVRFLKNLSNYAANLPESGTFEAYQRSIIYYTRNSRK